MARNGLKYEPFLDSLMDGEDYAKLEPPYKAQKQQTLTAKSYLYEDGERNPVFDFAMSGKLPKRPLAEIKQEADEKAEQAFLKGLLGDDYIDERNIKANQPLVKRYANPEETNSVLLGLKKSYDDPLADKAEIARIANEIREMNKGNHTIDSDKPYSYYRPNEQTLEEALYSEMTKERLIEEKKLGLSKPSFGDDSRNIETSIFYNDNAHHAKNNYVFTPDEVNELIINSFEQNKNRVPSLDDAVLRMPADVVNHQINELGDIAKVSKKTKAYTGTDAWWKITEIALSTGMSLAVCLSIITVASCSVTTTGGLGSLPVTTVAANILASSLSAVGYGGTQVVASIIETVENGGFNYTTSAPILFPDMFPEPPLRISFVEKLKK